MGLVAWVTQRYRGFTSNLTAVAVTVGAIVAASTYLLTVGPENVAPRPRPAPQQLPAITRNATPELVAQLTAQKRTTVDPHSSGHVPVALDIRTVSPSVKNVRAVLASADDEDGLTVSDSRTTPTGERFTWTLNADHSGRVRKVTRNLQVQVTYDVTGDKPAVDQVMQIPFTLDVETRDYGFMSYFLIIAAGIIISFVVSESGRLKAQFQQPNNRSPLLRAVGWLLLSIVMTPALYLQFKDAVAATDQAMLNLAIGLPFGAGVDLLIGKTAVQTRT